MRAGLIRYSRLERNVEELMVHEHVVVTLGHEVTMPVEGAPMAGQQVVRRFTNVWVRENDQWRMFSRHASNTGNEE
jgi:hypothetical protein